MEINPLARKLGLTLLRILVSPDTVYPSICPDGTGGVVISWKARSQIVEIQIDSELEYYVRARNESGTTTLEKFGDMQAIDDSFPYVEVGTALDHLTETVNSENPAWRELFVA